MGYHPPGPVMMDITGDLLKNELRDGTDYSIKPGGNGFLYKPLLDEFGDD